MNRGNNRNILALSVQDIQDDFRELRYLAADVADKLSLFEKDLFRIQRGLPDETLDLVTRYVTKTRETLRTQAVILDDTRIHAGFTETDLFKLIERKYSAYANQRVLSRMIGALVSSVDWQSPGYAGSGIVQAGRDEGRTVAAINDYKRDQHSMALLYETGFKKEYLSGMYKLPFTVLTVHSGMAAFATILGFLLIEKHITGPVLAGKSTYFEALDLLRKHFGENLIIWDETDIEGLERIVKRENPTALFLDSLGNTPDMIMPDMRKVSGILKKYVRNTVYLVIDNTCMSTAYNPFRDFGRPLSPVHLIVYESLNKFHQFGLDRTLGGVISAGWMDGGHLFDYREHLGTIIGDSEAMTIPSPNRKIFDARLRRLNRNAGTLALSLSLKLGKTGKTPVTEIVYPGIPSHPSYSYSRNLGFHGAFFMIDLKEKYRKPGVLKRVAKDIIKQARKRNVRMVAGTSFGLPVTRVYPTALHSKSTRPFLRIAAGTETQFEILRISDILEASLKL